MTDRADGLPSLAELEESSARQRERAAAMVAAAALKHQAQGILLIALDVIASGAVPVPGVATAAEIAKAAIEMALKQGAPG